MLQNIFVIRRLGCTMVISLQKWTFPLRSFFFEARKARKARKHANFGGTQGT